MVPPGDNLEFQASGAFRDRADQEPAILNESKAALKRNPALGNVIAGIFKKMDVTVDGSEYVVFFKRRRNVVAFVAVFDASDEVTIKAKENELKIKVEKGEVK